MNFNMLDNIIKFFDSYTEIKILKLKILSKVLFVILKS
jgi:hypothetical protein